MNRLELAETIAIQHELLTEAARIIATITETIIATDKKGHTVSIVCFGAFKRMARAARPRFNPSEGTKIKIPAGKVPKFVAGAGFQDAVDPKAAKRRAAK